MAPIFGAKIYKPVLPQPNCLKISIKFPVNFIFQLIFSIFPVIYISAVSFRSFRFGRFVSVVSFRLFRFGRFVSVVSVVSMVSAVSFRSFRFDVSPFSTCHYLQVYQKVPNMFFLNYTFYGPLLQIFLGARDRLPPLLLPPPPPLRVRPYSLHKCIFLRKYWSFPRLSQSPFWNTDFSSLLRAFFTDLYCGRGLAVV